MLAQALKAAVSAIGATTLVLLLLAVAISVRFSRSGRFHAQIGFSASLVGEISFLLFVLFFIAFLFIFRAPR